MDSKLYNATMEGNINILKLIAEHLNLQLTPNKNTVLHIAALFGQTECAKDILKMNSSLLLREGQQDSVDALIKYAKKLDAEGSVELESGSTMTKKMLRATNEDGDTALHNYQNQIQSDCWQKIQSTHIGPTMQVKLHFTLLPREDTIKWCHKS
ncbi:hypothetical protein CsSME_00020742 [Camellia sinensis var. sinensis]